MSADSRWLVAIERLPRLTSETSAVRVRLNIFSGIQFRNNMKNCVGNNVHCYRFEIQYKCHRHNNDQLFNCARIEELFSQLSSQHMWHMYEYLFFFFQNSIIFQNFNFVTFDFESNCDRTLYIGILTHTLRLTYSIGNSYRFRKQISKFNFSEHHSFLASHHFNCSCCIFHLLLFCNAIRVLCWVYLNCNISAFSRIKWTTFVVHLSHVDIRLQFPRWVLPAPYQCSVCVHFLYRSLIRKRGCHEMYPAMLNRIVRMCADLW